MAKDKQSVNKDFILTITNVGSTYETVTINDEETIIYPTNSFSITTKKPEQLQKLLEMKHSNSFIYNTQEVM